MLMASSEGAVALSRAEQSLEPFNLVSEQLIAQVRRLRALVRMTHPGDPVAARPVDRAGPARIAAAGRHVLVMARRIFAMTSATG